MLFSIVLLALCVGDGDLIEDFEGAGSESWERVVSDTHPPYNIVERVHDPELAKSGSQYLHFRTMGGSTAVRRGARHPWPVEGGRPYRTSVWVRLSGTKRNAAFLSLTWVNAAGDVLAEQRSEPLTTTGSWTLRMLEIPLSPAGATGVLPGLHFEGPDVRGLCDFDLLEVVPAQMLEGRPAGRATAVFTTDEYSRFTLSPAGLPPGVHSITATMTSPDGKSFTRSATIDIPSVRSVAVDFPLLPAGIHQLQASVDGHDASHSLAVLVTPPGLTLDASPVTERPAGRPPETAEDPLQRRILDPRAPIVATRRLFDAGGNPTAEFYALRIVDHVLAGAEPMPDPGLFPPGIRVAAFRKGASVLIALWSEGREQELVLPFNEGRLLSPLSVAPRALRAGEKITVGSVPQFILDVDPLLTELRLDLSSSELPLQLSPARLALKVRNVSRAGAPRNLTITLGELPSGWRASSRRFQVAELPSGSVHEETLDLIVPPSESERAVDLRFTMTFLIQGTEQSLQVLRRISLKSPIRIESTLSQEPSRTLSLRIVNTTDHPMTLSLRSRIPGLAERLELIRDLAPGSRSKAFEYAVREGGTAEITAQEAGGDRAVGRRSILLK